MTLRIAINGFGRIGRNVLRALYTQGYRQDLQIVAINDLGDSAINAHLLKYDTVHGTFEADVQHDQESLTVNGDRISVSAIRNPAAAPAAEHYGAARSAVLSHSGFSAALAERVNQALIDSFPSHQPFLPWAKASPALQDTRNNLRQALLDHAQAQAEKRYFILTPDQTAVIGCVGLHPGSAGEHVLGYWANSGFSGQGLMAEGIRALLAAQETELGASLDAFCDHLELEVVGHGNHR